MFTRQHGIIFGSIGHVQAAAFYLLSAVLSMLRQLHFYYLRLFWPCSSGCIFIILGLFGHVEASTFFCFSAFWATFGRLQLCPFPPFWPCLGGFVFIIIGAFGHFWPYSRGHIFIIFGLLDHAAAGAFLLFLAICAMFWRLQTDSTHNASASDWPKRPKLIPCSRVNMAKSAKGN